ncbi:uncharacterized protein LOC144351939 [Saccoglossus kowalevskii]
MAEKKKRRPNWTSYQLETLVDQVAARMDLLFAKGNDSSALEQKAIVWKDVAYKMNTISNIQRDYKEIRRKWVEWSSFIRVKAASLKKDHRSYIHVRGTSMKRRLNSIEQRVMSILDNMPNDDIVEEPCVETPNHEQVDVKDVLAHVIIPEHVTGDGACSWRVSSAVETPQRNQTLPQQSVPPRLSMSTSFPAMPIAAEQQPQRLPVASSPRSKKIRSSSEELILVQIEKELLTVEKRRLEIEERKMKLDEERLEIEKQKVQLLEKKIKLYESGVICPRK